MKFLIILWLVLFIIFVLFLFYSLLKIFISWINGEKIYFEHKLSFKGIGKSIFISFLVSSVIGYLIFLETNSFEVSLTVYILLLACIMSGFIRTSLMIYQSKRRNKCRENEINRGRSKTNNRGQTPIKSKQK